MCGCVLRRAFRHNFWHRGRDFFQCQWCRLNISCRRSQHWISSTRSWRLRRWFPVFRRTAPRRATIFYSTSVLELCETPCLRPNHFQPSLGSLLRISHHRHCLGTRRECTDAVQDAKISLLSVSGVSPMQLVFGRNPEIPRNLLSDNPDLVGNSSLLQDRDAGQAARVRTIVRTKLMLHSDKLNARRTLHTRPRVVRCSFRETGA